MLLIGFLPAVSEEGISRMFSISFLDRIGAGRILAVVLPAIIWGFGHAAYPNQPFYIRGVEVGVAGILMGFLMLRYGVLPLLVWHFTVDAIYTAFLLLRSGNTYYVVSGSIAAGILLLPLAASAISYRKRGGFLPEEGLTNGDEGFVPTPPAAALAPEKSQPFADSAPEAPRRGVLAVFSRVDLQPVHRPDSSPRPVGRERRRSGDASSRNASLPTVSSSHTDRFPRPRSKSYGTGREKADREAGGSTFSEPARVSLMKGEKAFERLATENLPLAIGSSASSRRRREEWKVSGREEFPVAPRQPKGG